MENLKCNQCQKEKHPDAFGIHTPEKFRRLCDHCYAARFERLGRGLYRQLGLPPLGDPQSYVGPDFEDENPKYEGPKKA